MISLTLTAHGAEAKESSATTNIKFTRFLAGSGAADVNDESIILKVQKIEQEIPITSMTKSIKSTNTEVVLKGAGNSNDVKSTYMLSELGLYAKLDDGDEFCYAYGIETGDKFAVNPLYDISMSVSSTLELPSAAYSRISSDIYEAPATMDDLTTHIKATVADSTIHGISKNGTIVTVGGIALAAATSVPDLKVAKALMESGSTSATLTVSGFDAGSPYMVMCTGGDASDITTSVSESSGSATFSFSKTSNAADTTIVVIYTSPVSGGSATPSPAPTV